MSKLGLTTHISDLVETTAEDVQGALLSNFTRVENVMDTLFDITGGMASFVNGSATISTGFQLLNGWAVKLLQPTAAAAFLIGTDTIIEPVSTFMIVVVIYDSGFQLSTASGNLFWLAEGRVSVA